MSDKKLKEQLEIIEKGIKQVSSSKTDALKFLKKAGILTESGKLKKAYRPQAS